MQQINMDRLIRDLNAVAADVEELTKATAGNADEAMVEVRERIASSLRAVKDTLRDTNNYVHDNVWKVMGVAAGVGLLVGVILSRSSGSSRSQPPAE